MCVHPPPTPVHPTGRFMDGSENCRKITRKKRENRKEAAQNINEILRDWENDPVCQTGSERVFVKRQSSYLIVLICPTPTQTGQSLKYFVQTRPSHLDCAIE